MTSGFRPAPYWPVLRRALPLLLLATIALLFLPATALAAEGFATWYGQPFHGRVMANGHVYDMYDPTTTASNLYPFGTWVKVTNPANGRSVVVQVRDRGAFSHALDLSYAAFASLDDPARMMIRVSYEVVPGPNPAPVAPPASPPTPTPPPAPGAKAAPSDYVVVKGDSLIAIARRFGLDVTALAMWNNLSDANVIVIGQRLALTGPSAAQSAVVSSRGPSAEASATGYTVIAGDTLWAIANRTGTTPKRIAELSDLGEDDLIYVGQVLKVPAGSDGSTQDSSSSPTGSNASSTRTVTVQAGDTLFGIALRHDITVAALVAANSIANPSLIQPGQVIKLP